MPARSRTSAGSVADVMNEPHVEHPIGLVEDEILDRLDLDEPLPDEIEEPPRRRHEDVDATGHGAGLRVLVDAAVDHRALEMGVAAVGFEAVVDLPGELARRRENEDPAMLRRGVATVVHEPLDERQREGRRLTGAGLRTAEEVAAGEDVRHRLGLDRRRRRVALVGERLEERLGEPKRREGRNIRAVAARLLVVVVVLVVSLAPVVVGPLHAWLGLVIGLMVGWSVVFGRHRHPGMVLLHESGPVLNAGNTACRDRSIATDRCRL